MMLVWVAIQLQLLAGRLGIVRRVGRENEGETQRKGTRFQKGDIRLDHRE